MYRSMIPLISLVVFVFSSTSCATVALWNWGLEEFPEQTGVVPQASENPEPIEPCVEPLRVAGASLATPVTAAVDVATFPFLVSFFVCLTIAFGDDFGP
jgi:hypothetical protein